MTPKHIVLLLLWALLWPDVTCATDLPFFVQANFITLSTALLLCTIPEVFSLNRNHGFARVSSHSTGHVPRKRRSVCVIFTEMGPTDVRRA